MTYELLLLSYLRNMIINAFIAYINSILLLITIICIYLKKQINNNNSFIISFVFHSLYIDFSSYSKNMIFFVLVDININ